MVSLPSMSELPPGPVCCVSALSSSGSPKATGTNTKDICSWRMLEHDAAIQLNLAPNRQEVTHRNNNMTSGYYTSTQISKKRQTQALLLTLQSGTLCGCPRSCNTSCRPYCAMADSKRNWWGLTDGGAKPDQSCNAADTYLVESRG